MATFLTILAVLAGLFITFVATALLLLRKAAVKGGIFLLRAGADQALASCNADWVPAELKAEIQAIHDEALALPAVSLFNAGDLFGKGKDLGLRLAAFVQKFEELKPKPVQVEEIAPTVLALPAPDGIVIDVTATEPTVDTTGPTCVPPTIADEAPVVPGPASTATDVSGDNDAK